MFPLPERCGRSILSLLRKKAQVDMPDVWWFKKDVRGISRSALPALAAYH